jgi:hypothetical protein
MALRPRFSPGLPLSLQVASKTNGPGGIQARAKRKDYIIRLRRPGDHDHSRDYRPMALRPRLSSGLPLSDKNQLLRLLRCYYNSFFLLIGFLTSLLVHKLVRDSLTN